jgi:hypothetical protein
MTHTDQVHLICTDDSCGAEYIVLKKSSCATPNPLCGCGSELKRVYHIPIRLFQTGFPQPTSGFVFAASYDINQN